MSSLLEPVLHLVGQPRTNESRMRCPVVAPVLHGDPPTVVAPVSQHARRIARFPQSCQRSFTAVLFLVVCDSVRVGVPLCIHGCVPSPRLCLPMTASFCLPMTAHDCVIQQNSLIVRITAQHYWFHGRVFDRLLLFAMPVFHGTPTLTEWAVASFSRFWFPVILYSDTLLYQKTILWRVGCFFARSDGTLV